MSKSSDVASASGSSGKANKRRSMRAKGGKGSGMETGQVVSSVLDDEVGFEISTKVKGLKKLKESSGRSNFGGDIYQTNTLELPYTEACPPEGLGPPQGKPQEPEGYHQ